MSEELKKMVDEDIEKLEKAIQSGNLDSIEHFVNLLVAKYRSAIDDIEREFYYSQYDSAYILLNAEILIEKLKLFKVKDCENTKNKSETGFTIHNSIANTNTIDVNISFEQARGNIENMTSLLDSEIEEILNKINVLEKIIQSSDKKTKKWENVRDIIKWIADKSVDVGIALLPLLLQIK